MILICIDRESSTCSDNRFWTPWTSNHLFSHLEFGIGLHLNNAVKFSHHSHTDSQKYEYDFQIPLFDQSISVMLSTWHLQNLMLAQYLIGLEIGDSIMAGSDRQANTWLRQGAVRHGPIVPPNVIRSIASCSQPVADLCGYWLWCGRYIREYVYSM